MAKSPRFHTVLAWSENVAIGLWQIYCLLQRLLAIHVFYSLINSISPTFMKLWSYVTKGNLFANLWKGNIPLL